MQQEMNKHKKWAVTFWILTVICMAVIFYFSAMPAATSSAQSNILVRLFAKLFGERENGEMIVRKCAHCLEFTGLSLLLNSALYFTAGRKHCWLAVVITSLYAATDEMHQLLVDGRSCQFIDWVIDSAGALLGAAGFLFLFAVITAILKQKQTRGKSQ